MPQKNLLPNRLFYRNLRKPIFNCSNTNHYDSKNLCILNEHLNKYSNLTTHTIIDKRIIEQANLDKLYFTSILDKEILKNVQTILVKTIVIPNFLRLRKAI